MSTLLLHMNDFDIIAAPVLSKSIHVLEKQRAIDLSWKDSPVYSGKSPMLLKIGKSSVILNIIGNSQNICEQEILI